MESGVGSVKRAIRCCSVWLVRIAIHNDYIRASIRVKLVKHIAS
jgi:hypothetical protein